MFAAILTVMIPFTAMAHPHPKYDGEDRYQGFTDAGAAKCPSNPEGVHVWHNVTGTETNHEVRRCCWCGQQRFVDVRVIGKERAKKYDFKGVVLHGTVSTTPTDYSGTNNPQPVPGTPPISADPV